MLNAQVTKYIAQPTKRDYTRLKCEIRLCIEHVAWLYPNQHSDRLWLWFCLVCLFVICLAHINAHIRAFMGWGIDLYRQGRETRYMRVYARNTSALRSILDKPHLIDVLIIDGRDIHKRSYNAHNRAFFRILRCK